MKKGYFRRVAAHVVGSSVVAATLYTAYAPEKVSQVVVALLDKPGTAPQLMQSPFGTMVPLRRAIRHLTPK